MTSSDSYKLINKFFVESKLISSTIPIQEYPLRSSPLISILRPYQLETVRWMIMRELCNEEIQLESHKQKIILPRGGVLADEMGLGKTVEILACILGNPKKNVIQEEVKHDVPESIDETNASVNSTISDIPVKSAEQSHEDATSSSNSVCQKANKRSAESIEISTPCKKPRTSNFTINRTLKKKIKEMLSDYNENFQRFCKRRFGLEVKDSNLLNIGFKVTLLNRFYENVRNAYSQEQTWGFLVTEFNIDDEKSLGYSVLRKEMNKKKKENRPVDGLTDEDAFEMMILIDEYVDEKLLIKFKKDFDRYVGYSMHIASTDVTLLLDQDDVKCRCGSNKMQGKKIMCQKCQTYQHLKCVGLDSTFTGFSTYYCPHCLVNGETIESSATLIVIPPILMQQWEDEIKKHATKCELKIYLYQGVNKEYILPQNLAQYDIVLVNFDTLRMELNFISDVAIENTRNLRHIKRYLSFPSPLTDVHWWRLCIDEAQMVESPNKVSEMVSHLKTVLRWAVTGTPIGKSLKDLYGLTTYLQIKPFTESFSTFENLLCGEQNDLHKLFAYIMRRITKNEISSQLGLPEIEIQKNFISFTPIEGYFYQYTHSIAKNTFMDKMKKVKNLDQLLHEACRKTAEGVLAPLLSLRQACVHPQAVNKKNMINLTKTITMKELLEQMIKKAKVECDDTLRLYIMNINGAAAVKVIMGQNTDAANLYRSVLSKMKELPDLTTDDFQMIHALYNLYEISLKDPNIMLSPQEQEIPQRVCDLERKYIEKRQESVFVLLNTLDRHVLEIENFLSQFTLSGFDWWARLLKSMPFEELNSRVQAEMEKANIDIKDWKSLLHSSKRLEKALKEWLKEVEDKRKLIREFLQKITKDASMERVSEAAKDCHFGREYRKDWKRTCILCKMEDVMILYENLIFNKKVKINQRERKRLLEADEKASSKNPLNWQMSAQECILTATANYSRIMYVYNPDENKATNHLKVLQLIKREFKTIRATWTQQCEVVQGYDEVNMAKSRFDAVTGSMDKLSKESPLFKDQFVNYETNCQNQYDIYQAESVAVFSRLTSKLGSLHYLMNLRTHYENGEANECCPVCHVSVDGRRGVMPCGHFTCYQCMLTLTKNSRGKIFCPFCRIPVLKSNITYVYGGGTRNAETENVRGNYSVKMLNIVSKVLRLTEEDPTVKILIFSTWDRVLDVLERALKENDVSYKRLTTGIKRKVSLSSFKENSNVNALLIPLQSGSKGLNLTEASHVMFTEPVINVADEKQAIGRIDRLGQTKKMTVHKFIVRSTIEEHLLEMNDCLQQNNSEESQLTFRHLKELVMATSNTCSDETD